MRDTWLGLGLVVSIALTACGGSSDTDFGSGTGGKAGSGGAKGGTGGKATGGNGGSSTGGSNTGGVSTGGVSTGGVSTGGTGGDTGGTGGDKGGTGGDTGGTGGDKGGTGGTSTGGTSTGGTSTGGTGGTVTGGTGGTVTGGTGGTATGGSGGTGGINTGGTGGGGVSCATLESDYAKTLAAAKACNPLLSILQCTKEVADELACPCSTFVNPGNTEAFKKLATLQAQWTQQGCQVGVICPAVLCKVPTGATCQVNGSCKDF